MEDKRKGQIEAWISEALIKFEKKQFYTILHKFLTKLRLAHIIEQENFKVTN